MRRGRPIKTYDKKEIKINFCISIFLAEKLEYLSKKTNESKSEIIRKAIEEYFENHRMDDF